MYQPHSLKDQPRRSLTVEMFTDRFTVQQDRESVSLSSTDHHPRTLHLAYPEGRLQGARCVGNRIVTHTCYAMYYAISCVFSSSVYTHIYTHTMTIEFVCVCLHAGLVHSDTPFDPNSTCHSVPSDAHNQQIRFNVKSHSYKDCKISRKASLQSS